MGEGRLHVPDWDAWADSPQRPAWQLLPWCRARPYPAAAAAALAPSLHPMTQPLLR